MDWIDIRGWSQAMTAKQFSAAIDRLGLSQVAAARLFGLTDRSARRYAAGDAKVPEPTAKLLRLALAGKVNLTDIERA